MTAGLVAVSFGLMKTFARLTLATAAVLLGASQASAQATAKAPAGAPAAQRDGVRKISTHVWLIPDSRKPAGDNVGVIVGSKAALIVDAGIGPGGSDTVLKEATRLAGGKPLYLVATHVSPDHDLGSQAFPAGARVLRAEKQVQDIADNAALLKNANLRPADVTFDPDYNLDLGGVKVQLLAMGMNHSLGDTVVWVNGDQVLFSGDLAMKAAPDFNAKAGMRRWRATLNALATYRAKIIVPSHGPVGDAQLINAYQFFFGEIETRVGILKKEGKTVDQVLTTLTPALAERFSDAPARLPPVIRAAYAEAP